MNPQRFELALELIHPAQWKRFEDLASEFLSSEFPNLRTMAAPSGDRGRDAELFCLSDDPSIMLQYSVTADWKDKIRKTVTRIKSEFPKIVVLIYVTNQIIGAAADDLKKELREKEDILLDNRDRTWFVERLHSSQQREIAAERLAQDIVDPYLESKELLTRKATALTSLESQAAFLYLSLQWEDDTREKGLTKLCFEGLIRAVLRGTHPENRLARDEIRARIRSVLPNHPADKVDVYTDSALSRLTKRFIRHYRAKDEFCLMNQERRRLQEKLAIYESADSAFHRDLSEIVRRFTVAYELEFESNGEAVVERVRRVLEQFLLSRGEAFAAAVRTGDFQRMGFDELKEVVIRDLGERSDSANVGASLIEIVMGVIRELVEFPSETVQHYLRSLSDAYTLLAFLRETPDVQAAITKMFSGGEIWLDTSVILPILAEDLLQPENQRFRNLLRAASEAGLRLYMTNGVLEEVERHLNRSVVCHRTPAKEWVGRPPFLYALYTLSGRALAEFPNWLDTFMGSARPEDDIADYLEQLLGIELKSLEEDTARADSDLRISVQEIWNQIHDERRRDKVETDPMMMQRLASHDSENYLGVIQHRRGERDSPFGYSSWWLTLDRDAFAVKSRLRKFMVGKAPDSPVLSPDFLSNYLAFGPIRRQVSKGSELSLPVVIDRSVAEYLPLELFELAESVREELKGRPEHVIRRKVRDSLDAAKARRGSISQGGIIAVQKDLEGKVQHTSHETTEKH